MVTRMRRPGPSTGAAIAVNAELPEGDGKAVVQRMCVGCHGAGTFIRLRMSRREWQAEVANMLARGARAPPTRSAWWRITWRSIWRDREVSRQPLKWNTEPGAVYLLRK